MTTLPNFLQQYDYILDKPAMKLQLLEGEADDGGAGVPSAVDSFLMSVVEAYGMVGEMTSADKQQVSSRSAAVKEKSVQCNQETIGGSFDAEKWKCISKSVMNTLIQTVEEARRAQMLRQLQLCEHNIRGILKCEYIEIMITEFQRLLVNSSRLLEYVYKYLSWGTLKGHASKNLLLLCASQLKKLFAFLICALDVNAGTGKNCAEVKGYVLQRMKICFEKIKKVVEGEVPEDESDDLGGGLFMIHMDQAVSLLAVFGSGTGQSLLDSQWRTSVEAVLQHAMAIAQIASPLDFKMIHASGEKILRESDNLERECKSASSNPSVCKLHAMSLSDALEELEQRVCASVLKMYLQVFSDLFTPLETLLFRIGEKSENGVEKTAEDLSDAISTYDSHMDRLLQVALFAVACSEDKNRVLGIRSCLASLESLETNLVPALTALYLKETPSQVELARLLVEHWNIEVKELWLLIDGIIDPVALAQVVHSTVWTATAVIKKSILAKRVVCPDELKRLVRSVVLNADVLVQHILRFTASIPFADTPPVILMLNSLELAVKEGSAVLRKMDEKDSTLGVDRILKRCELLVTCVKNILPLLEEVDNPDFKDSVLQEPEAAVEPQMKMTSVLDTTCVKSRSLKKQLLALGLPSDAQIDIDVTDSPETFNLMQTFMDKTSTQPRFATSFLYNDKTKTSIQGVRDTPKSVPSSSIFIRKVVDLEEKLLQNTFSLPTPKTLRPHSGLVSWPPSTSGYQVSDIESELEANSSSRDIATPERIQDLLQVQTRIDAVKISSEYPKMSLFYPPNSK
ncbi:serendipity locus protein alpha-like isoform X2 [Thrips palmi]|uniref:Serendipity locus protein alpha-like isoform X2 n=1 Tax=Thrips palmi TaxID=161013 RepID=A0A6P8YYY7_THRPL|nr:serendipity locus protein alpha-like isoform X2 [Thrips palmi]